MKDIVEMLQGKKWDKLIIFILLGALFIAMPLAVNYSVGKAIEEHLEPMQETLKDINSDVYELKRSNQAEITERAVAAYSKIMTVEDLKNNPSNQINIKMGLLQTESKSILMTMDRERTLMFIDFLFPNGIEDDD